MSDTTQDDAVDTLPPPPPPKAPSPAHGQEPGTDFDRGNETPGPEAPSPLLTRLNRLSMSTSRPNLPPQEGYATRTLRSVSSSMSSVSNSLGSLGSMWDSSTASTTAADDKPVPALMRRASASLDTSAILYPTLENHPAPLAHPLLVLDLAALTAVPNAISNEQLLATLLGRLEPWVGEENEGSGYCLIVLAAEDQFDKSKARALPGVAWWLWHWRRIPRKYRKNLKRLYIVHPSTMTRTMLPILLPLVSPKSYAKLHTVPSLLGLARRGISLAGIDVPLVTLTEEARVLREHPNAANGHAATNVAVHGAPGGWWGSVTSLLPWGQDAALQPPPQQAAPAPDDMAYWSQDIDVLVESNAGHLPRAMRDLSKAILRYCTDTEGIFRRSPNTTLSTPIRAFLNLPLSRQPRIDWTAVARLDPLLPPILYKRLLSGLPAPIIPTGLYPALRKSFTVEEIKSNFLSQLSPARAAVLEHTAHMAHHLAQHEDATRMGARNLAIVIAPALIAGDPREDAMLCMEAGRVFPPGLGKISAALADSDDDTDASELGSDDVQQRQNTLAGLLETYISKYPEFAGHSGACDCAFLENPGTPVRASPRRGHWKLGAGAGLAPPVAT